jgi:hypothetical protein
MDNEPFNKADDLDNLLDEIIQEVDVRMYGMHLEVYETLTKDGVGYLNIENNENRICSVYEALICFMLNEDFEKCAYIKKILSEFGKYRIVRIQRSTQLMLLKSKKQ